MKRAAGKKRIAVHVGEGFDAVATRVAKAWHRAERGERVHEHHVTFATWDALSAVMTPRRMELLRHVRRHPAPSIAALAREIGRDYRRVHDDVKALSEIGLLEHATTNRTASTIRAPFDQIQTTIRI